MLFRSGLAMSFATIIYLPFAITHLPENAPSSKALFATIGLGILCTAMAFWIFFIVLDEIGPARASLVVYPNTAIAVVLGIIVLREPLTLAIVIGLPMVLIGSYFASRKSDTSLISE